MTYIPFSPYEPFTAYQNDPHAAAAHQQLESVRLLGERTQRCLDAIRDISHAVRSSGWTGDAAAQCSRGLDQSLAQAELLEEGVETTVRLMYTGRMP